MATFRARFAQLLPVGRFVARGQGAVARAIGKVGLSRWGVAFPPPFCYTDFSLSSYFNRLQSKCPIELRLLGCLETGHKPLTRQTAVNT